MTIIYYLVPASSSIAAWMNYNPAMIMFGEQQQQHQHLYGIILLEDEMRHTLFLFGNNNYIETVQCVSYHCTLYLKLPSDKYL